MDDLFEVTRIPAWIIAGMAILCALEYFMRFCKSSPPNFLYLGKALSRSYLAIAYVVFYLPGMTEEVWRHVARYGVFLLLATELFYFIVEHYQRWRGLERRNCWLHWRGRKL